MLPGSAGEGCIRSAECGQENQGQDSQVTGPSLVLDQELKIYNGSRISCVVAQELEGCPADGGYRGRVQEAVTALQSRLVPSFASQVDTAAAGLQHGQDKVLHPGLAKADRRP